MKIVHIITRLIVGGAQENTLLSCEGQHDNGHDVTLITGPSTGAEGSLMPRATAYGYAVEVIDEMQRAILPVQDLRTYLRLVRRLKEIRPDIVHTHSSKAGIIGRYAAHHAGMRAIVHTIHGLSFTASTSRLANRAYAQLERRTAPLTSRIVCVADAMREQSLAANIGRPEQYVTVYSGMETRPFLDPPVSRDVVRRQLAISDEHVVVGTIARLFHMKGHDDILHIAPRLCAQFANLRFLWVGDGVLRASFEERIAAIGLKDRFILTGLVPPARIPELTHAMDILIHPSRREGLARALPQGALAGKPVVTYDVDGNREALIDGQTGFLLPPFDVEKLFDAVATLASEPTLCESMGRKGREFAIARFDAKVMVAELEKVYQSALSPSPLGGEGWGEG